MKIISENQPDPVWVSLLNLLGNRSGTANFYNFTSKHLKSLKNHNKFAPLFERTTVNWREDPSQKSKRYYAIIYGFDPKAEEGEYFKVHYQNGDTENIRADEFAKHPRGVSTVMSTAMINQDWIQAVAITPDGLKAVVTNVLSHNASIIDLDTVSRTPLWTELGDAWRSWCNTKGENVEEVTFDLDIFEASLDGYLGALRFELGQAERESLAWGVERISLELATRFCADALNENYFGWDNQRFATAGEHNLLRAQAQLSLHEQAVATRDDRLRYLMR